MYDVNGQLNAKKAFATLMQSIDLVPVMSTATKSPSICWPDFSDLVMSSLEFRRPAACHVKWGY